VRCRWSADCRRCFGPGCALSDPAPQKCYLLRRQPLPFGRHFHFCIQTGNHTPQPAFIGIAWDDDRPRVATAQSGFSTVETQPAPLLLGAVARMTAVCENRLDIATEINLVRHARRGGLPVYGCIMPDESGEQR